MYSSEIIQPLGNGGMTLLASNCDDTTKSIPDIGFDFFYNNQNCRNSLKISGNSWVGFTGSYEQLKVNRRDTRAEEIYYANETIDGANVFRIRWEGDHYYSYRGAYDLIWELILFQDGAMVLIIEKITDDGTDSFVNPGVGTTSYDFQAGKSYTFIPSQEGGVNYTIQEGSYTNKTAKYLIVDGTDVKHWDNETSQFVKVSELPLSSETFINFGDNIIHISSETFINFGDNIIHKERTGIVSNTPVIKIWTDLEGSSIPKIVQTAIPKATIIEMKEDMLFNEDYILGINNAVIEAESVGSGIITFIVSKDSGVTWKTFNGSSWINVDKGNLDDVKTNGMSIDTIEGIAESRWEGLVFESKKLRFAWYMEITSSTDVLELKQVMANYNTV